MRSSLSLLLSGSALALATAFSFMVACAEVRADPVDRWLRASALERGCTLMRGKRTCARYCYIEANGYRYCRERERDAEPQAPGLAEADASVRVK